MRVNWDKFSSIKLVLLIKKISYITLVYIKWHPLQKIHPNKSNSHNIKLYDFDLNMIHFMLIIFIINT